MTVSTHVLDTERGMPAAGRPRRALPRRRARRLRRDRRRRADPAARRHRPGHLPDRLPPELAVLPAGRARGRPRARAPPRSAARLVLRVRDLPRQLSVDELAELFEGRTAFVERLAALEDPLGHAREVAATLTDDEKKEVLDAHPAIGERKKLSKHSAAEQGADYDPAVIAELLELNRAVRGAVRLPLRRLRQPPAQARADPDPPRAPRAHARAGARHRASTS